MSGTGTISGGRFIKLKVWTHPQPQALIDSRADSNQVILVPSTADQSRTHAPAIQTACGQCGTTKGQKERKNANVTPMDLARADGPRRYRVEWTGPPLPFSCIN